MLDLLAPCKVTLIGDVGRFLTTGCTPACLVLPAPHGDMPELLLKIFNSDGAMHLGAPLVAFAVFSLILCYTM
jgi:hypothetical protein